MVKNKNLLLKVWQLIMYEKLVFLLFFIFITLNTGKSFALEPALDYAIVKSESISAYQKPVDSFIDTISIEDAVYKVFDMKGDKHKGLEIIKLLKKEKPKIIFALGVKAAYLMSMSFKDTPVLFAAVLNWKKYEKVLTRDNVCGISLDVPPESMFTQLKMTIRDIKSVGVLYNEDTSKHIVDEAKKIMRKLGIKPILGPVKNKNNVKKVLNSISNKINSLWVVPDPEIYTNENFSLFAERTLSRKIPFVTYSENFVRAGALFSVSVNYQAIGAQAADLANQIINEITKPKEIGVVPPIGSTLVINIKTAEKIKLKINQFIINTADVLIKD